MDNQIILNYDCVCNQHKHFGPTNGICNIYDYNHNHMHQMKIQATHKRTLLRLVCMNKLSKRKYALTIDRNNQLMTLMSLQRQIIDYLFDYKKIT